MPGHGKVNKSQDNGVFQSRASIDAFPRAASDTMFFTATSYDWTEKRPTKDEGRQENMLYLHEIGRKDCRYLRQGLAPLVPGLTRNSQSYTLSYRPKQPTDWELNRYNVEQKKLAQKNIPQKMIARSNYTEFFRGSSPEEMRRAKPAPRFSSGDGLPETGNSLVTASHSQTVHTGPGEDAFEAGGAKVLPIHNLAIDGASKPDFWQSRYRKEFEGQLPTEKCHGQSPKWRKRQGTKMVNTFLQDIERSIRQMNAPADRSVKRPVNFIGSDWQHAAAI
eukprot:TRINITY_DN49664_c0_g1_i1.p1 TRINITY_DN49664_c0_g1~~TRINITY_DN49664_c0_g1_i1.p1  ORF type:complete len:277 (-),score=39.03 TRINITY_DN49664_c0_g1_i1:113-943(-)